ncbi:Flagellar biosynthesis protein FlhF [Fervidicola ferrireducens]|jgi:flagellar biosynthesis protein FlhF|uniref:Flagellar biosynthesis protein FlhF n=1 Tax=Fervidicola ferrireducens TaxID=520764 RepID=A0A140LAQ5_9FIRM|nr:flagellar biosynthesis protein FlhF [Fervidicola ferrireducens]KXG77630.1 Flagellar biosynthesis protein FlhF [Fervidicola ferrireducens]
MRIKTYVADNIQEALYKVKSELGKDAIILQTRQIKKGGILGFFSKPKVEVIAASDIVQAPKPQLKPISYEMPVRENSRELEDIKNEINEVKDLLKSLSAREIYRKSLGDLPPPLDEVYKELSSAELEQSLIDKLIDGLKSQVAEDGLDKSAVITCLKNQIATMIKVTEPINFTEDKPSKVVFIGPTGVGKTTTIAKLAAVYSLNMGKKVGLVAADTYRVGAVEQLKTYGDLLEIPVEVIFEPADASRVMKKLSDCELVLVDTMGTSPRNKMQIKRIKSLIEMVKPTEIHMVISVTTKAKDVYDILESYKELNYQKLVFTKLDETNSYGLILNAIIFSNCSPSYLTAGQNVPDDIEVASGSKIADLILGGCS